MLANWGDAGRLFAGRPEAVGSYKMGKWLSNSRSLSGTRSTKTVYPNSNTFGALWKKVDEVRLKGRFGKSRTNQFLTKLEDY
jgi:hypothetical protein